MVAFVGWHRAWLQHLRLNYDVFQARGAPPALFLIVFNELWCIESTVAVVFQPRVFMVGASLAVVNS